MPDPEHTSHASTPEVGTPDREYRPTGSMRDRDLVARCSCGWSATHRARSVVGARNVFRSHICLLPESGSSNA